MPARDAVIVDAVRTPVGKQNGSLAGWHAADLSAHVLRALVERTGIDPAVVDDVVWGCVQQVGQQSYNVGRMGVLAAGWPESVPAVTIDRQCGSSQQSVHFAAAGLVSGQYDVAVAGGVEIMSAVPLGASYSVGRVRPAGRTAGRPALRRRPVQPGRRRRDDGREVGLLPRRSWTSSPPARTPSSPRRSTPAVLSGQIAPVGEFAVDEGLRRGTSVETLAALKPSFKADGIIHAGNASQISDGAAALLHDDLGEGGRARADPDRPGAHGRAGRRRPGDDARRADPGDGQGAVRSPACPSSDIGAFEVNEAFAPVPLAWLAETGADPARLNVHGGAIAIGHPLGASGARLVTALVHHMRDDGVRYGLQTMCEGGGMANATIFERL